MGGHRRRWPGAILRSICPLPMALKGVEKDHIVQSIGLLMDLSQRCSHASFLAKCQGSHIVCDLWPVGASSNHKSLQGSRDRLCGIESLVPLYPLFAV